MKSCGTRSKPYVKNNCCSQCQALCPVPSYATSAVQPTLSLFRPVSTPLHQCVGPKASPSADPVSPPRFPSLVTPRPVHPSICPSNSLRHHVTSRLSVLLWSRFQNPNGHLPTILTSASLIHFPVYPCHTISLRRSTTAAAFSQSSEQCLSIL